MDKIDYIKDWHLGSLISVFVGDCNKGFSLLTAYHRMTEYRYNTDRYLVLLYTPESSIIIMYREKIQWAHTDMEGSIRPFILLWTMNWNRTGGSGTTSPSPVYGDGKLAWEVKDCSNTWPSSQTSMNHWQTLLYSITWVYSGKKLQGNLSYTLINEKPTGMAVCWFCWR